MPIARPKAKRASGRADDRLPVVLAAGLPSGDDVADLGLDGVSIHGPGREGMMELAGGRALPGDVHDDLGVAQDLRGRIRERFERFGRDDRGSRRPVQAGSFFLPPA